MNGMDPNNPPPKQTRITLKQWEYSDPIGVPHPDSVDVAIDIKNNTDAALDRAVLEVDVQWLEGPLRRKSASVWTSRSPVRRPVDIKLAPEGRQRLTVPVALEAKMKELEALRRWPWALRAFITVKRGDKVISSTQVMLPITPGD
jgi:hypothetical protein